MSSDTPWKTVLIEGHALLRNLIAKSLRLDHRFELLAEVEDGVEGRAICLRMNPDLVVMDVRLVRMDGIGLARDLMLHLPKMRLLVLSQMKDSFTLNRLHEIGVHGFVEKDQSLEILEEAMVEVASGRKYFTATLCRNQERLRTDPQAFSKILSSREQEILWSIARGLTSKTIAQRLELSPRSVETYRYRIRKKLEIRSLAGLIDFAFRAGFLVQDGRDEVPRNGRTGGAGPLTQ